MSLPSDSQQSPTQAVLGQRLGTIAIFLFILFCVNVLARILPARLLLPSWQLEFAAALIDAAPLALLGLILVHLAAYVDPLSPIPRARKQRFASLAIAAVIGFLLLIPLNTYAVWRGLSNLYTTRRDVMSDATSKISQFKKIINEANTPEDLQERLGSIGVPGLKPSDLRQPLPLLKQKLLENLDKAKANMEAKKVASEDMFSEGIWSLIQSVLKLGVSSAALALAFAAGAQRINSDVSLLESWNYNLRRRRLQLPRRDNKPTSSLHEDYNDYFDPESKD